MVLSAADRFGDAEAVVDGPLRLTFVELADRIRRAAGAFAEFGVGKGDRVAVWAPNSAEWIIAAFGIMTAGGSAGSGQHPVQGRGGRRRRGAQRRQGGHGPEGLPRRGFQRRHRRAGRADDRPEVGLPGRRCAVRARRSTGTTSPTSSTPRAPPGRPKGAMMNHRQTLRMYEEWATLADLREGDRYLMINPYFHTFGLKAGLIASFLRGATMLPGRRLRHRPRRGTHCRRTHHDAARPADAVSTRCSRSTTRTSCRRCARA